MGHTIRNRITTVMLASVVPLFVGYAVEVKDRYDSDKGLVMAKAEQVSQAVASFTEAWLDQAVVVGGAFAAHLGSGPTSGQEITRYLSAVDMTLDDFQSVFAIGLDGRIYGESLGLTNPGQMKQLSRLVAQAVRKSTSEVVCLFAPQHACRAFILYPVRGSFGGAVGTEVRLPTLLSYLRRMGPYLRGHLTLTDASGRVVLSTNPALTVGDILPTAVSSSSAGPYVWKHQLRAASAVPSYGWVAITSIDLRQAMAPAYRGAVRDVLICALVLCAAMLMARWLSLRLAQPVADLQGFAKRVSHGDFPAREFSSDITELQNLASVLHEMGMSLATMLSRRTDEARLLTLQARAMKAMSEQLGRAQEDERRRLARELHDWTNEFLASIFYILQSSEVRDAAAVAEASERLTEASVELRRIMNDLHPHLLDTEGLLAACRAHMLQFQSRTGIQVNSYLAVDESHLSVQGKLTLFRILQEALANAMKHSGAASVSVSLLEDADSVSLCVKDDGIGMQAGDTGAGGSIGAVDSASPVGFGLTSMAERAASLGGKLDISSAPGAGTLVRAVVPKGSDWLVVADDSADTPA